MDLTIKREKRKEKQENILENAPEQVKSLISQSNDIGESSWFNSIPLRDQNLNLNKVEFRDALCLRYNLPLKDLPCFCACGEQFNVNHALTCAIVVISHSITTMYVIYRSSQ